jgi:hypothetical protein
MHAFDAVTHHEYSPSVNVVRTLPTGAAQVSYVAAYSAASIDAIIQSTRADLGATVPMWHTEGNYGVLARGTPANETFLPKQVAASPCFQPASPLPLDCKC